MSWSIAHTACSALTAVSFLHCAGQIAPSGGPPDTVPPAIIRTYPDTNATRVRTEGVELEFSEYVDRRSVEESIFISPYVGELEFDWSGREVTILFSQTLREHTTYVVNIGTDIVDRRARNRMASSFSLAFSTGDSIDQCSISGRVFDARPEGLMIFAYRLADVNPDTLDPSRVRPDYITQTGKDGLFTIAHIANGTYRVIAVRDEHRNLIYDRETDDFGVPRRDIAVTYHQSHAEHIWFRLSREDTTKPFLTAAGAIDRNRIRARFSEALDSLSFSDAVVNLVDTVTQMPVQVLTGYLLPGMTSAEILTAALDSQTTYRLSVDRVRDRAGHQIDPMNASYVFEGTAAPDSIRPTMRVGGIPDSSRGIPLDRALHIEYSEAVVRSAAEGGISLVDSSRVPVGTSVHWLSPIDMIVQPRQPLVGRMWYTIHMVLDSLRDHQGNGLRDSTFDLRFESLDLRGTGAIEGTVLCDSPELPDGPVYVAATGVGSAPQTLRSVRLEKAGPFRIEQVVEGRYILSGFIDADSSRTYSFGRPFPFLASECFGVFPDTLKVRARWGLDGITIQMK